MIHRITETELRLQNVHSIIINTVKEVIALTRVIYVTLNRQILFNTRGSKHSKAYSKVKNFINLCAKFGNTYVRRTGMTIS